MPRPAWYPSQEECVQTPSGPNRAKRLQIPNLQLAPKPSSDDDVVSTEYLYYLQRDPDTMTLPLFFHLHYHHGPVQLRSFSFPCGAPKSP